MTTIPTPPEGFRTRGPRPSGTRLVLIRHGEAVCNAEGIVGGERGCGGLTELGRLQAHALAARLAHSREFDDAAALYSSTLPRARQTLEILLPSLPAVAVEHRDDLRELLPGEADGLNWDDYLARFPAPDWAAEPDAVIAPGGESWLGFFFRCHTALERLVAQHPAQLVIVVCHGGVIEQLMKLVRGDDPAARLRLRTENCSLTEVEFRDDGWHLLRYNDRAPLDAATQQRFTSYVDRQSS